MGGLAGRIEVRVVSVRLQWNVCLAGSDEQVFISVFAVVGGFELLISLSLTAESLKGGSSL